MAISFSTNKDGENALYINDYTQLASMDTVSWLEVAVVTTNDYVTLLGFLSPESLGIVNYKDRNWKPGQEKCTLKVYNSKRKQWDKDAGKYVSVETSREENYLFKQLSAQKSTDGQVFSGTIRPWVNPYFWELNLNDPAAVAIAEQLTKQIVALTPTAPERLTNADIEAASATESQKSGKFASYTKPETEAERIAARCEFVKAEFAEMFEFTSLFNLASQIEGLKAAESNQHLDYQIAERLIQLITMIGG